MTTDKQANTIDEMTMLLAFRQLSERQRQAVLAVVLGSYQVLLDN